jgi:hypothetical protein
VSNACRARFESGAVSLRRGNHSSCAGLTSFADAEELVDVPGDDSAGESAPTPLEDAAQGLLHVSANALQRARGLNRTNGSVRRSSVARPSPLNWPVPS